MFSAKLKLQSSSDIFVAFVLDVFSFFRLDRAAGRLLFRFLQFPIFLNDKTRMKLEDLAMTFFGLELRWFQGSAPSMLFVWFFVASLLSKGIIAFGGDSGGRPFTTKSIMYIQRYLCKTESHLSV